MSPCGFTIHPHFLYMTDIGIPGWVPTEAVQPELESLNLPQLQTSCIDKKNMGGEQCALIPVGLFVA